MIAVVTSIDGYHDEHVASKVSALQKVGYEVTGIKRVKRMFLFFGTDVTHVTYRCGDQKRGGVLLSDLLSR